ncbi:hypothetical protein T492DRAFT_964188 [Pavlovales sp. CCMP2436]|nr:hypothetical protein T492DRAFT_964188 [Pavlovales sp. CCMP2436]
MGLAGAAAETGVALAAAAASLMAAAAPTPERVCREDASFEHYECILDFDGSSRWVNVLEGLSARMEVIPAQVEEALAEVVDALLLDGYEGRLPAGSYDKSRNWAQHAGRATLQFGAWAESSAVDAASGGPALVAALSTAHAAVSVHPLPVWLVQLIDHLVDQRMVTEEARPDCATISRYEVGDYMAPSADTQGDWERPSILLALRGPLPLVVGQTVVTLAEGAFRGSSLINLPRRAALITEAPVADYLVTAVPRVQEPVTVLTLRRVGELQHVQLLQLKEAAAMDAGGVGGRRVQPASGALPPTQPAAGLWNLGR